MLEIVDLSFLKLDLRAGFLFPTEWELTVVISKMKGRTSLMDPVAKTPHSQCRDSALPVQIRPLVRELDPRCRN